MKGWHKVPERKAFFQSREDMEAYQKQSEASMETDTDSTREATETEGALISQGAEGKVYFSQLLGRNTVTKERLKKKYRVPALDAKINRTRLLQEARCMCKCEQLGIQIPHIYMVDVTRLCIYMERIDGLTFKAILRNDVATQEAAGQRRGYSEYHKQLARKVGQAVARMHAADIVHGDLTTSNIMVRDSDTTEVVMIDFGLGAMQMVPEDKAVDLYVLERSFLATHPGSEELVSCIMEAYGALYAPSAASTAAAAAAAAAAAEVAAVQPAVQTVKGKRKRERSASEEIVDWHEKCLQVLKRLESVRMRGRKRDMFG